MKGDRDWCWAFRGFIALGLFSLTLGNMPPSVVTMRTNTCESPIILKGGNSVCLSVPAKKVAVLAPVLSTYVSIEGGLNHIIGVSHFVLKAEWQGMFRRIFPALSSLELKGTYSPSPDPEGILLLQPDAAIVWRVQAEILRKIGYPALVELDYSSLRDANNIWRALGEVANQEPNANNLLLETETLKINLQKMLPGNEKPTAMPMAPYGEAWWIGGTDQNLSVLAQEAGAVYPSPTRVFSGYTNPEVILHLNPELIFVPVFNGKIGTDIIYNDQRWEPLKAIQSKRVYAVPYYSVLNVRVEEIPLLFWLAELLHPSLPKMTRAIYQKAYADAYHYDLSDDEIDQALLIKQNAGSAGYQRFQSGAGGKN